VLGEDQLARGRAQRVGLTLQLLLAGTTDRAGRSAWQALLPDLERALGTRLDMGIDWATEMVTGYACGSRPAIQYRMRIEAVTATVDR
jgi:hypothetical protein